MVKNNLSVNGVRPYHKKGVNDDRKWLLISPLYRGGKKQNDNP